MQYDPFSLRLSTPLSTARGTIEHRDGFVVRIEAEGVVGLGEASPFPGWTESRQDCADALASAATSKSGDDLHDHLATSDWGDTPAARHGIELALVDAEARSAGVSLASALSNGSSSKTVPVNATVGDGSVESTAQATRDAVEQGYSAIKVKVGARDPEEDAARLRAVREAAGDAVELRADANGAWDRSTAEELLDIAAALDFAYVEQPLAADDLRGHADLRGRGVDIALDESVAVAGVDRILDAEAADVLVCKPMVLGGPRRTFDVAREAFDADLSVVITTTIDAVIARTAAVHVAAALPEQRACGLATGSMLESDLAPDPAPVEDGAIEVPEGPGTAGDAFDALRTGRDGSS